MKKERRGLTAALGFTVITIALLAVCAGAVLLGCFLHGGAVDADGSGEHVKYRVVIDAGHGGMDGGAVGADGTLEKDINLAVAKKLRELCAAAGIDCVLTRSDDAMLLDGTEKSHRKMHDLKNRVKLAEDTENALFVSIHMNNFPVSRYSGLQVWYSKNDSLSKSLASYVQTYARTYLDGSNEREIKRAGTAIYVLDKLKIPAILIECGFLSNPEECAKLRTDEYQTQLAVTIFAGIIGCLANGM